MPKVVVMGGLLTLESLKFTQKQVFPLLLRLPHHIADISDIANKQLWPLCVCILNFPKALRDKLLRVVVLCGD